MTVRCGFAKAPRATEIYAIFLNKEARATLGRVWRGKHGQKIWELLVKALDEGLLARNNRAFSTPSLWLLFPSTPAVKVFEDLDDLRDQNQLSRVRDVVLPFMIDCRDKLMADPERAEEILTQCREDWKRSILEHCYRTSAQTSVVAQITEQKPSASADADASVDASIDQLVGEIESRIEKLAQLCIGSMDIASRQRLVDRLNNHLAQMLLPDPST
jgi:hypothetical protein